MSVDYPALRANQPDKFRAAADRWQDLATRFNNEISHYQHDVAEPVGKPTWSGGAAQAARKAVRADQEKLTATHRYLRTVHELLDDAHSGAMRARQRSED